MKKHPIQVTKFPRYCQEGLMSWLISERKRILSKNIDCAIYNCKAKKGKDEYPVLFRAIDDNDVFTIKLGGNYDVGNGRDYVRYVKESKKFERLEIIEP